MSADSQLDNYIKRFYNDNTEFERPFLRDLDKTAFKGRFKEKLSENDGFDFGAPISEAIELTNEIKNERLAEQERLAKIASGEIEPPKATDDRNIIEKGFGKLFDTILPDPYGDKNVVEKSFDQLFDAVLPPLTKVTGASKQFGSGVWDTIVNQGTGALRSLDSWINEGKFDSIIFDKDSGEYKYSGWFAEDEIDDEGIDKLYEEGNLSKLANVVQENVTIGREPENYVEELAGAGATLMIYMLGVDMVVRSSPNPVKRLVKVVLLYLLR